MKIMFLGFCLFLTNAVFAIEDPVFEMNKSWVGSIKRLLSEIEKKEGHLLVKSEDHFFGKFQLIQSAWADARFNCFYGGWPSQKKNNLCQHPEKTNPSYSKSSCKVNEFQCQPLLFGQGVCLKNISQQDKTSLFSRCEKKFQAEKKGDYQFLKNLDPMDSNHLRELSILAADQCKDKNTESCREVMNKFDRAMGAINKAQREQTSIKVKQKPSAIALSKTGNNLECDEKDLDEKLAENLIKIANKSSEDDLYDKIKDEFLSSPFCDPSQVLNDPKDRPAALTMKEMSADLNKLNPLNGSLREHFDSLVKKYELSDNLKTEAQSFLNNLSNSITNYESNRVLLARMKGVILQDFIKNYKDKTIDKAKLAVGLADLRIFKRDESKQPTCPFVSKDAFLKAMAGRKPILEKYGSKVSNKNIITIVDYTRPSNERRLYVIDISTGKVLHNTWVAHGSSGKEFGEGQDGFGSNPKMSNAHGSLSSSDGFIIAGAKSRGNAFGNNLLLNGIDRANSNLMARSVVMHRWNTPFDSYSSGFPVDYNSPPVDVIQNISSIDFKSSSIKEVESALSAMSNSLYPEKYLRPTEGCLGVTTTNVKHLDRKGRDKSQLELLRDDLPGSIIFNYSGTDMKSNFF